MMAIGGGAAGSASMAGTITILKVGEQAKAYIAPSAVVAAGGNVIILADSSQKILVVNGSVSAQGQQALAWQPMCLRSPTRPRPILVTAHR